MLEVLVNQQLPLSGTVVLRTYCDIDQSIAQNVLNEFGIVWEVELHSVPSTYARKTAYAEKVSAFIQVALSDPDWRGNGLEFDRV
jgi:hypothetical protein